MKFLVDAQLPPRVRGWLVEAGADAVHTRDLPSGNATPDSALAALADRQNRVVLTKDADFVAGHLALNRPARLVLLSCGNIRNDALDLFLRPRLQRLLQAVERANFIEMTGTQILARDLPVDGVSP